MATRRAMPANPKEIKRREVAARAAINKALDTARGQGLECEACWMRESYAALMKFAPPHVSSCGPHSPANHSPAYSVRVLAPFR
jgi:hypothetical protein